MCSLALPTLENRVAPFDRELAEAMERLQSAIGEMRERPESSAPDEDLAAARVEAAGVLARWPQRQFPQPQAARALSLVRALRECGAGADSAPAEIVRGFSDAERDLPRLLALMLVAPAWRCVAPLLSDVPEWMWGAYAEWLFSGPRRFTHDGDSDRFAKHLGRHVEELARWVERNLGSTAVRAALEGYLAAADGLPSTVSTGTLRAEAAAHGRILAAASGARRGNPRPTTARTGRPLRVVFVASHPAALPAYGRLLDSAQFEVSTFALEGVEPENDAGADVAVAAVLLLLRANGAQAKCRQLPPVLSEQMAELAQLTPDVIVYAEDLALSGGKLAQLAAQRIAPLQIAIAPASVTTGLANIDLFGLPEVAADGDATAQFSERLALLPGIGHLFPSEDGACAPAASTFRDSLQLPAGARLLVTAARLIEITAETLRRWTELLQRVPNTVIAVQLLPSATHSLAAIEALGASWDAMLTAAAVEPRRGLILAAPIASQEELREVVAAGDVFLDSGAFGEPDLVHVPLALGMPIVTRPHETLRTRVIGALLRTLGCDDLVAANDEQWIAIIEALANDESRRAAMRERIRAAMENQPLCCDALAAAEALGQLLIRAYDELHELGGKRFRAGAPLRATDLAASDWEETLRVGTEALAAGENAAALAHARAVLAASPAHAAARWLAGRALMAEQRHAAAVEYLLAAVQVVDDAAAWFDLATALQRNGQSKEALQALETSLKRDGSRADAWVMLIELAKPVGADDCVREALAALRACAPDDPRIPELAATLQPA